MQFSTVSYVDVSTAFITEKDRELILCENAPHLVAIHKDRFGSYFYVEQNDSDREAFAGDWRKYGFSERFIEIMTEAGRQGYGYVVFDADGGHIEGLEPLEDAYQPVEPPTLQSSLAGA